MESSPIKIETKDRKGEDFVSIIIGEDLSHTSTAAQERNRNRLLLCVTGSMGRSCSTGGKRKDYVWPVVDNISDNISRPGVSFSFSVERYSICLLIRRKGTGNIQGLMSSHMLLALDTVEQGAVNLFFKK